MALAWLFADHAATALANAQLYTEVQAGQVRLQDLSRKLLEAHEAERRRIAHELHDEAGQLLASVHIALETTIIGLPPQFQEGFHQVRSHLDAIETQLRPSSRTPAHYPGRFRAPAGPPGLSTTGGGAHRATHPRGHRARRPAGACSRNGALSHHARGPDQHCQTCRRHPCRSPAVARRPARARPSPRRRGGVCCRARAGPDKAPGPWLLGIQERLEALGGTLQITSAAGQGTTLQITLPAAVPDPVAGGALPQGLWSSTGAY